MASLTHDGRSFIIDGKRVWLVSGAVHYFRTPAALWPDRLLKAKRAGLNCISTFVPWNFHEAAEGQWDFTGDRDIAAFIRTAGELGLYVILQPGPFIGADWDFGGLPAYLTAKSGIAYRTNNAVFSHYFDRYFRQLLPRLADLQITRSGNIILVQSEHEFVNTTMPDRLQYLEFINQLLRRSGFDIPIIHCNRFSDPPVTDGIECVNGWDSCLAQLKRLRTRQASSPLLVTEFQCSVPDTWGQPHQLRADRETARRALEILGCGAQFNYANWHGGTNFAFWGGQSESAPAAYQTTSYDSDAPLAEGGGLTPKYYLTRLVNLLANHMGSYFAQCAMENGATNLIGPAVLNLTGPTGKWAIVTNNGADEYRQATLALPGGEELQVSLDHFGAAALPIELRLTESHVLNYANLTPLGFFGGHLLVLHGPANSPARLAVNASPVHLTVPQDDQVQLVELQGLHVAIINSDLAQRCWPMDTTLLLGPQFVGPQAGDLLLTKGTADYAILTFDGNLSRKKLKPSAHPPTPPVAPRLGAMHRLAAAAEPLDPALAWQPLDNPRDVDQLGQHYGYVWYRIVRNEPRAVKRTLLLGECEDRASIYLNGEFLGVWGRGPDAVRTPITAHFHRGQNVLTLLVDNLGRFSGPARLGQRKGLFGHLFSGRTLPVKLPKLRPADNIARRVVPRGLAHLVAPLERLPLQQIALDVTLTRVAPLQVSFKALPHHAALLVNDRVAGFFPMGQSNFGDAILGSELKKGKNSIQLLLWGDVDLDALDDIHMNLLEENISLDAAWSWRPWQKPTQKSSAHGKDLPAWLAADFHLPAPTDKPLFVQFTGDVKGQLFLNGSNIGRVWTAGPQQWYYLPASALQSNNQLLLFEEQGKPTHCKLEYRPQGPFDRP